MKVWFRTGLKLNAQHKKNFLLNYWMIRKYSYVCFMKTLKLLLISLLWLTWVPVLAQSLPVAMAKKIDSLFMQWDTKASPGCGIGIIRNDSLIYAKGYGMANLEYNISITPETIFNMASVSKQVTALSIVLLAREGRLNLDDDIHKYLPWFPDMKEKITIRNLLSHTSGIREHFQLAGIAGSRIDDVITEEEMIKLLTMQQSLNFKPGSQYSYSNSNYTLLAEIVKKVTGKTLRQFTDSAIFKPLDMHHTWFYDDYTEIVPNFAYSYWPSGTGHYSNAIVHYSTAGPSNLFSSVDDMSKWIMNFYDHRVGDQQDIVQLTQKGKLNNGKELQYAMGIEVDSYNGQRRYQHSGSAAGYRTFISVFPELKMGFIVFGNVSNFRPQRATEQITNLFIKDVSPKKNGVKPQYTDTTLAELKDTLSIKKFLGDYISDDHIQFHVRLRYNKLWLADLKGHGPVIVKAAKDTFEVFNHPEVKFVFSINNKNEKVLDEYWPVDRTRHLVKFDPAAKPDKILLTYTGTYYCPELDCNYHIVLKDHNLILTSNKYDIPLSLYGDDHLTNGTWWMDNIMIVRDSKNQITGFEVDSDRVMHLWFKKVN